SSPVRILVHAVVVEGPVDRRCGHLNIQSATLAEFDSSISRIQFSPPLSTAIGTWSKTGRRRINAGAKHSQDVTLDCHSRIVRVSSSCMTQNQFRVAIDDYSGVRAMSRQCDAQPAMIRGKSRKLTVTGKRMDHNNDLALQSLSLIRGTNEHAWEIGKTGRH